MGFISVKANRPGAIADQLQIHEIGPDTSWVGSVNQHQYQLDEYVEKSVGEAGRIKANVAFSVGRQICGGNGRVSDGSIGQAALIVRHDDAERSPDLLSTIFVVPFQRHMLGRTEKVVIDGQLTPAQSEKFNNEPSTDDFRDFFQHTINQAIKMTVNQWTTLENLTLRNDQNGS